MNNSVLRYLYVFPTLISSCFLVACSAQPTQQTQSGQCPQNRTTEYAPASIAAMANPFAADEKNMQAGEELYQTSAAPVACAACHGEDGDGNGRMANMFEPAPRNFTCSEVVGNLSDGQLFWIIKNGSIGTSMPAFFELTDKQIWQLTIYLRTFEIRTESVKKANADSRSLQVQLSLDQ